MPSTTVEVPTPDGVADAFLAVPDGGGRHPAVLLCMDAIGLRPVIREMAERLAGEGYCVLAPNFFYRHGRAPLFDVPDLSVPENREAFIGRVMPMVEELTPELARRDTGAFLDYLDTRPEVRVGPVGVTGYCMGGVLAVRTAAAFPGRVAAAAAFHPGPLVTDAPDSPHRVAARVTAELYFGHAEQDDAMHPEVVPTLEKALDAAGVRHAGEVYPGTQHGFTMADTSAFSPEGLRLHWERLLSLFDRTLKTA